MKRTGLITSVAVSGLLLLALVASRHSSLDGLQGSLLRLVLPTDTEYAKSYTEEAFRGIQLGQTKEQVLALLGAPLIITAGRSRDVERWLYSRSPGSTNYSYREIQIAAGVVQEKKHFFYID